MQAGDRQIGDAGEDIGKPSLWVDLVKAACGDDRQHDGGSIAISPAQLSYLLSGIDWRHPQETFRPTKVG